MSPALVELTAAGRNFGPRVALAELDLTVAEGEIVGLAGPNGSGKTTLLKLLAGLLRPSAGVVRVLGLDPFAQRAQVMERARFAFAPPPLYDALTGREHLERLSALRARGAARVTRDEIDAALAAVGLSARADDRVRAYSFGMRQRLALAQALVPSPELLVLDEPTDGLDPLAILELRAVLQRLRSERGTAILLSSHLLIELDRLVDRLCVLDEGRELFTGAPHELCAGTERLLLGVDAPERAAELLRARGHAPEALESSDAGALALPPNALSLEDARALLAAGGVRLLAFHEERPGLERALLARLAARRRA